MDGVEARKLSITELLQYADRSDPITRELCARLETHVQYIKRERTRRNEFKRELNSLMGMLE